MKTSSSDSWIDLYNRLREYRKTIIAPVDTIGCDKLARINAQPSTIRFQILISLLLSSQTKDQITSEAISKLNVLGDQVRSKLQNIETDSGFSIETILQTDVSEIENCIKSVGFWRKVCLSLN